MSENYLEIHLFWAGKGTCCNPVQGYYGPSISAISVVSGNIFEGQIFYKFFIVQEVLKIVIPFSDFEPSVTGIPPNPPSKKNNSGLIVGVVVSVGVVSIILICAILYLQRKASSVNEDEGNAYALHSVICKPSDCTTFYIK